jgi:hypothetical protein
MPFKSEAQRAWMYSHNPDMAAKWQAHTPKDKKLPHKVANPQYAEGMRSIRRSNAAGTHDERPNRERSRSDALRKAISRSKEEY